MDRAGKPIVLLSLVEGNLFVLQVTFDTNQEFTGTIKAGRDKCCRLTQPPLLFGQHQNPRIQSASAQPDERDVTSCAWHFSGTAEDAAGKLNMLPSN